MIFAEMDYEDDYSEFHQELYLYLSANFSEIKCGLQGDSWFWIFDGEKKVAIDTFTSMKHQIKSNTAGLHVQNVIDVLLKKYKVNQYENPELEGYENENDV